MKCILICTFLLCLAMPQRAVAQETLTNQMVIEMMEIGFEKELIIEKINASTCDFQTDIATLKLLKGKGVPPEILTVMIRVSKPAAVKAKTGIYVLTDSIEVQLLPTVFSGSNTNTLAFALSYGIASAKVKSLISGVKSSNILPQGACTFVFYFDPEKDDNFGLTDWWFRAATSPNEFALARLRVNAKKNYRELEVGSVNAWTGSNQGVNDNLICEVTVEKRADGAYIVTPTDPLDAGEYCFYYKGIVPQGGYNNQSAFDFSVAAPAESTENEIENEVKNEVKIEVEHEAKIEVKNEVEIAVAAPFVLTVGHVTCGEAVDGLPLPEGLLYVGRFGGWNGGKYTKGLYLEPCGDPADATNSWADAGVKCAAKGMVLPSRDQLVRIIKSKAVANNSAYGFAASYYWSSTADDEQKGWCVQAPSGNLQSIPHAVAAYVRCITEY